MWLLLYLFYILYVDIIKVCVFKVVLIKFKWILVYVLVFFIYKKNVIDVIIINVIIIFIKVDYLFGKNGNKILIKDKLY